MGFLGTGSALRGVTAVARGVAVANRGVVASNGFARAAFSTNLSAAYAPTKLYTREEARDFMSVFPDLVRDLTVESEYKDVPSVNKHLSKCIQYNASSGKRNRGLTVPVTFKAIVAESDRTDADVRLANIMGWCVEFLQAYLLVADDIMDGSVTRRGQECWYRKDNLGVAAFNDALILEACVYAILEKHFEEKSYYMHCLHEFIRANRSTCMGQSLDLLTSKAKKEDGTYDLDTFDMKLYSSIVKYKTSIYSFHLPVALGMHMAGVSNANLFAMARTILLRIGHCFQVQDDYLDCYGDPEVTGKVGTDIEDGKCSWLIVMAMQRATRNQREELKRCYGTSDPVKTKRVRDIFDELKLQKMYKAYEEESYNDIMSSIEQIPGEGKLLPPRIFTGLIDKIYQREN